MSSAIDTTVDFRRKLLRFDRPLYPQYVKSDIPRFYSGFIPSWRSYFVGPSECDSQPEHYRIGFPLRNIESQGNTCHSQSDVTITPNLFNLRWILLCFLFLVLLVCKRKLFVLILIGFVY